MNKGLTKERMKRVKWASDDKICQVKMFTSEDFPSQISRKTKDHVQKIASVHSNEMKTLGSRRKENSSTSKQIRNIPVIKWKCPPEFTLKSVWQVMAGEESEERATQNYRESIVSEALYPRVSAIPSSPGLPPEWELCDYDDTQTPTIPLSSIEDEEAMPIESMPHSEPVECSVPTESKAIANEELHTTATGFDADVVAAATVALTAMLKANEKGSMVDTDLLIKILNEPKMIEALSKTSTNKMASPIDPKHDAHAGLVPVVDALFDPQTIIAPRISSPNALPYPDAYSVSMPGKPVENGPDLSRLVVPSSSCAIFGTHLRTWISDLEPSRPSSLVSSTWLKDQSLTWGTRMSVGSSPSHPPVSTPAIIPVDNVSDLSKMVVPASSCTIFPPKFNPQNLDVVSSPSPSLVPSTWAEDQSLTPKSPMFTNSLTSFSVDTRVVKDVNYYKNLVRLHGKGEDETQERHTQQYQVSAPEQQYQVSAPEQQYQVSAPEPKVRKPCKFFNSSKGCRNGPTCPFEHATLPNLQAGKFLKTNRSKRLKISHEIRG
ncbi:hypothetical protein vseg_019277 [Gypsophila vaccaria]